MNHLTPVHFTLLTCLLFVGAKDTFAQNVLVDLSEDGTLSIVEEFVGGNDPSGSAIDIVPQNNVIAISNQMGFPAMLNGELQVLEFPAELVKKIECQNIYWLRVITRADPLIADLRILTSVFNQTEIAGDDYMTGTIVGDVEYLDGRNGGKLVMEYVNVWGNVTASTGQATDGIFFAQGEPSPGSTGARGPVQIFGNLTINTGQDRDYLDFGNGDDGYTYVAGDVDIQMGQGFDYLFQLGSLTTEPDSNVSISLGQQNPQN